MPWVTPRHSRTHECKPPRHERRWLHGLVCIGDVWRCSLCGTYHEVTGTAQVGVKGRKNLMWTRREPV